jgi:hypothetical protein
MRQRTRHVSVSGWTKTHYYDLFVYQLYRGNLDISDAPARVPSRLLGENRQPQRALLCVAMG